jgi:hypothetical protein
MWLFLNNSALSVVQHRDKKDVLLVRSRVQGDIERAIPEAQVWEDHEADYMYRAEVNRDDFKQALGRAVDSIDYGNFKASVPDTKRHTAYMNVWGAMVAAFGAYGKKP